MADEDEAGDAQAGLTFNNDGSFMEQFMKMQKEKEKSREDAESTKKDSPSLAAVKPVRKPPASLAQKMMKNRAAKKKLAVASAGKEGGAESKKESDPSATPSSTVSQSTEESPSSSITPPQPQPTTSATKGGRKRKSKWDVSSSESTADSTADSRPIHEAIGLLAAAPPPVIQPSSSGLPGVVGGDQQLTAAQQEQLREQIAMQKMVAEIKAATAQSGSGVKKGNRYEYDSDEEVEEGTWEHKARIKEMKLTEDKATELTEMGKGKHHIGDFLPPEEMEKFVETVVAVKEDRDPDFSDYKEHKLTEENIGFKLLQKAGWDEGAGLGAQKQGITAPVNKGKQSFDQSGLGVVKPAEVKKSDSEFDLYRKRMMLAYRFRPNPLVSPFHFTL
ncbi:SURP and G-patch domain-containing protein 1 [Geodia barretti]|uniref:SURP and G-patch domain-containing protein 1 n=1 Tax=Geodia barretti TaxID=519541 RepID=A0AA35SI41_GEOBA|nr:SURP and G-patch domain-containing protein 1 [Geodia barretti]